MKLNGYVSQLTPVVGANNNNWNLGFASTVRATVQEVTLGGYASSSTPMETAWPRTSTAGTTPPTAGNIQRLDQTVTSAGAAANFYGALAWATGPTRVAGGLWGVAWNSYGGVVRWLAAPGEEWDLCLSANGIVCQEVAGTGVMTATVVWTEF
jgi:hypothetical protein